ncbi:glycosyltransferase [Trujillonella endophytica]|uniref:Glycosyltransferase, MGT family n=1 Tax=Trujillonella endophytica TaxID=673521 RepID=A0A1H8QZS2_9ACTN|nr:glycosyltransferase [Trujillella endophytica]SEO59712.1 glycosyltransferase, MGT family [Trujillella endophytica]
MARILFTTMPFAGHLRPGLPIVRELVAAGHEVVWYSGAKYRHQVERAGARAYPMSAGLDIDDAELEGNGTGSLRGLRQSILDVFIHPIPAWVQEIDAVLDDFAPDVVVAEQGFMAGPLAGRRRGIPAVVFSVSPLGLTSADAPPFGTGLLPGPRWRDRTLNWAMRNVVFAAPQRAAEQVLARLGLPPIDAYFMDWGAAIADRYLVPSVPEFEYPRRDLPATVEFVGPFLPAGIDEFTPPPWWDDVLTAHAGGRPVVLVTQGTLATDPANLVLPAVAGLAGTGPLVIATTVGHDPDVLLPPALRPADVRLTPYVPFDRILPMTDVYVTNGGYGGLQQALAAGVPVVVAGTTEDKAEVSARVTWSGAGLALGTDTPTPDQVADAVATVLTRPDHRARARELQAAYARYRGERRAAEAVLEVAASRNPVG